MTGCIACHSPIDESRPGDFPQPGLEYAGRVWPEGSGFPGKIVAPNISPDPETGIGQWTDGEIVRAIREGVSRDGRPLFPLMNYPAYRDLTDEDVLAIVAYLRTRTPIKRDNGRTELDFPVGMMIRTVPQPLDRPARGLPAAGVERGRAMLTVLLCGECHTPRDDRGNPVGREGTGGRDRISRPVGRRLCRQHYVAPLDRDRRLQRRRPEAGTQGREEPCGRDLWVMPWSVTRNLTDTDIDALIAALREVPASPNLVPAAQLTRPSNTP